MSGEVSTSAPVAAAYAGQEYQCLVGWYYALLLLDPEGDVTSVSVEAPKVGPVDDVVIGSRTRSGKYVQVKFSVDSTNPINEDFWTGKTDGGQSFLQRLWKTFNELRKTDPNVALVLHANRPIYSEHPILKFRHSKTGRLDPALRAGKAKRAREQWEKHLGVTTDELLDLLEHLEINIDQRSEREFFEAIADRMAAYQLSRDIEVGRSIVRRWIIDGVRSVDRDQLRREIDTHKLHAKPPTALLVVQAIDHHKDAAQADASVDWVDLF